MYQNIVSLQNAHGLSDTQMGIIIGKTAKTYRKKVNGDSMFKLSEIQKLCSFFRCSAAFAFKGGEAK